MIRVLIADDHAVVRHGLRDILVSRLEREVDVAEASDAREAIALLTAREWDLILLDINMPGRSALDGLEEARRLRPDTPALILTSYPESEFAVRALKLGAAGYLTKQSAPDELITAVHRVLAGRKYVTASLAERLASEIGGSVEHSRHEALSHRELQVLRLVAVGKTMREVSEELGLSEKTVATYRMRISEKTGLKTNVEIARYALKSGLVE